MRDLIAGRKTSRGFTLINADLKSKKTFFVSKYFFSFANTFPFR